MKIAIAGSGALGSGFGAMLYRQGYDVTLIDGWEPQATAVKQDGLYIDINGEAHHLKMIKTANCGSTSNRTDESKY